MSRTITISDELYTRLEAEARLRGLDSVERFLEQWQYADAADRQAVILEIDALRERLAARYGEMPDSVESLRQDRAR